jgi:DNA-3-methyladenine glycosylase II
MSWQQELEQGVEHIRKADALLAPLVAQHGAPTFAPHGNYYQELVESIISQQLSVKAAATILGRFVDLFGHFPAPEEILEKDFDELRSVGLSGQKTGYIRDLAKHVLEGKVRFDHLDKLSNDEIITELTDVKGIGEWTVHMFLIFCMGRLDVLAYGDLGIRSGIMRLYQLDALPDKKTVEHIAKANAWQPYASIACWYIWKVLDNEPK